METTSARSLFVRLSARIPFERVVRFWRATPLKSTLGPGRELTHNDLPRRSTAHSRSRADSNRV